MGVGRRPVGHPALGPVRGRHRAPAGAPAGVASTVVHYGRPTEREMDAYLATGEPLRVAGGFTIDGYAAPFVDRIDGDHAAVLGLSLPLLRRLLAEIDIEITDLWVAPMTLRIGPIAVDPPVVLAPMAGRHRRAVPRRVLAVRRRALRVGDDHGPGARGAQRAHAGDAALRRLRGHPLGAALRHRPAHPRRGGAVPGRRGRRRPRRHELRLPGPQGHPQGRRLGAPGAPRAAARHRARRRGGRRADPGHHQVPHGRRRRDPHLPRHRPHRRGGGRGGHRAPRPHRRAALQRLGPLGRHRRAQGPRHHDPGARQRRHLGGPRRAGDAGPDRLRRRGGRAAAASGARGSSATSSTPSPVGEVQPPPRLGWVARGDARPRRSASSTGAARSAA